MTLGNFVIGYYQDFCFAYVLSLLFHSSLKSILEVPTTGTGMETGTIYPKGLFERFFLQIEGVLITLV